MGRLNGKACLVTAAGQGIGRASALSMLAEGAKVYATDVNDAALEELAAEGLDTFKLDVMDPASIAQALAHTGAVNILFNCAGFVASGTILDCDEEQWTFSNDLNVKAMYRMNRAYLPGMIAQGGGSIINIASVDGIRAAMTKNVPYAAAKGGMIAATKAMAVHHGRDNVRVNCIAPGMIFTSMVEAYDGPMRELRRTIAPLGTEGRAEDIAMAATFLASEESRWITGVLLPVDAGLMAAGPQSIIGNILEDFDYV